MRTRISGACIFIIMRAAINQRRSRGQRETIAARSVVERIFRIFLAAKCDSFESLRAVLTARWKWFRVYGFVNAIVLR